MWSVLFESGCTCWKVEYIQKIKTYFEEKLIADFEATESVKISIIA